MPIEIHNLPDSSLALRSDSATFKHDARNPEGGRIGFQTKVKLYVCGRCEAVTYGGKDYKNIKHWGWLCGLCYSEV